LIVKDRLAALSSWTKEAIHGVLVDTANEQEMKLGKLAQPIRIAVTGGTVSPPIDITMQLIGRERVLERLSSC
jgi:glutamyl-tRNA synthetase